jgi:hypothetical protein
MKKNIINTKRYQDHRTESLIWWKDLVFAVQRHYVDTYIHQDVNVKLISGKEIYRIWRNEVGYQKLRKI